MSQSGGVVLFKYKAEDYSAQIEFKHKLSLVLYVTGYVCTDIIY